ncbi:TIR domain-containing protein [Actinoplanes sp. NPDC049681]|uniref:TIR domain-containing protein n=1 Tax=Actinoplanes sp. NPDC049681 TaxID=3363905 RepID=UPI0037BA2A4A
MGFRAPSADDAYRYVFRIGDVDELTDRFNWTILVLNDSSPVCREFLGGYAVDLCVRTADRVRFVFFSDLPDGQFAGLAHQAYLDTSRGGPGLLGRVLRRLAAPVRLDFERDGWRDLRPPALVPFDGLDDIARRVGAEADASAAIPGSRLALQFAQRLGVGRHVPGLLLFADVGAPDVHVLPFGDRSAADVYARVRSWIDGYYELNRDVIERWRSTEDEIWELAGQADASLRSVRDWRHERLSDVRALDQITGLLRALPSRGAAEVVAMASASDVPWRLRGRLQTAVRRFAAFDAQDRAAASLEALTGKLAGREDPDGIRKVIRRLERQSPAPLGRDTAELLREAVAALPEPPGDVSPRVELAGWWRRSAMRLVSKAWFRRSQVAADYAAFRAALGPLSVAGDPAVTAGRVLAGLPPGAAGLADDLVRRLGELRRTAPAWVADLTFAEILPPGATSDQDSFDAFVAATPRLRERVEAEEAAYRRDRRQGAAEYARRTTEYRDLVCEALRGELRRLSTANDRRAAVAALETTLEAVRTEFENRLAQLDAMPRFADLSAIPRLTAALDEYDAAVQQIVYPYRSDPDVIAVRTRMSLPEAADMAPPWPRKPVADAARRRLRAATDEDRAAHEEWPRAREEVRALRHRLPPPVREPAPEVADALLPKIAANRFDVFMVHDSADKALVLEVCAQLRRRGIYPWVDAEQIQPGSPYHDVIQSAIRQVGAAAVFIGARGLGRWGRREMAPFLENGMPVIPVLLPGVKEVPEDLVFLRGHHRVEFTASVREEAGLDRLVWGITGVSPGSG